MTFRTPDELSSAALDAEVTAEQSAFDEHWRAVRAQTAGPIVRDVGDAVHLSAPGIEVAFDTRHLGALEAALALLRVVVARGGRR